MRGLAHTLSTIAINNIFTYKIYNDKMRPTVFLTVFLKQIIDI